jgi:hypothetical protein
MGWLDPDALNPLRNELDGALRPVIETLGEIGNAQTFDVFIEMLAEDPQLSFDVARKIFAAVVYLGSFRK